MTETTTNEALATGTNEEIMAQLGQTVRATQGLSGGGQSPADPGQMEGESSTPEAAESPGDPQPEEGGSADQGSSPRSDARVPLERLSAETSKRKAAEAEAQDLKRQLAAEREKSRKSDVHEALSQKLANDPRFMKDGKSTIDQNQIALIAATAEAVIDRRLNGSIEQVHALAAKERIAAELGVAVDSKQAALIAKVQSEGIHDVHEAYVIAQMRNQSDFKRGDSRGVAPMHASARPSGAGSPPKQQSEIERRMAALAQMPEGVDTRDFIADTMSLHLSPVLGRPKRK